MKLTRRELEITALIARGLRNREIAAELLISEQTVKNHVARIMRKNCLTSRIGILLKFVQGAAA